MHEVTFTKDEILTLRRALNALVTRQELNLIPASESAKEEIRHTIADLHSIDIKLLKLKPCSQKP